MLDYMKRDGPIKKALVPVMNLCIDNMRKTQLAVDSSNLRSKWGNNDLRKLSPFSSPTQSKPGPVNGASPLTCGRDLTFHCLPCLHVIVFSNLNMFFINTEILAKSVHLG